MNFEQAALILSIGLNVVLLGGLFALIAMLSSFKDKVKRASEVIDKKFAEQDKRISQIHVILNTLEVLLSFSNPSSIQRGPTIPPPSPTPKKNTLTVIKTDDKDPPR